ncbi:hypothetical protein [Arthrobacter sp. JSM 101049]|uniref:hypothetical protein n=1 Tax=Arthrobacter sp. JSM 101049 TaxID=929097 RepID=UPI0035652AF3
MSYYLEYTVPAGSEEDGFEFPVNDEQRGETIPLTETDADVVHTDSLPVRTEVFGASLPEAQQATESILPNSRARHAKLYDDSADSLQPGAGTLTARYAEGTGWQDAV